MVVRLLDVPDEVLELILGFTSRSPHTRREDYLKLSTVCRRFYLPSQRHLHRDLVISTPSQAERALEHFDSDRPNLAGAVRRLTLRIGSTGVDSQTGLRILGKVVCLKSLNLSFTGQGQEDFLVAVPAFRHLDHIELAFESVDVGQVLRLFRRWPSLLYVKISGLGVPPDVDLDEPQPPSPQVGWGMWQGGQDVGWDSEDDVWDAQQQPADSVPTSPFGVQQSQSLDDQGAAPSPAYLVGRSYDGEAAEEADPDEAALPPPSKPAEVDASDRLEMRIRQVVLVDPAITETLLKQLLTTTLQTLRSFHLCGGTSLSRSALKSVLQLVGPGLTCLELRDLFWRSDEDDGLDHFLDDTPNLCPFLTELSLSVDGGFSRAITKRLFGRLPLRHLEINSRAPHLEPGDFIQDLRLLPDGRLESLYVGPDVRWHPDDLFRLKAWCEKASICFAAFHSEGVIPRLQL